MDSTAKIAIGGLSVVVIGMAGYLLFGSGSHSSKDANHNTVVSAENGAENSAPAKKQFSDAQTKEIEEVVFNLVKEKNAEFMSAIQEGVQKQQERAAQESLKAAATLKDELVKTSITAGADTAALKVYAFIDPACPHCHDFIRTVSGLVAKSKDIQVHFVIAAMLSDESSTLAAAAYAANAQGADKGMKYLTKLIDLPRGASKAQLVLAAKDAGADTDKFEKDRASEVVKATVATNSMYVQKLKIPGFPTLYTQNKDGSFVNTAPMTADGWLALTTRAKAGEDISKPAEASADEKTDTATSEPHEDSTPAEKEPEVANAEPVTEEKAESPKADEAKPADENTTKKSDEVTETAPKDEVAKDEKAESPKADETKPADEKTTKKTGEVTKDTKKNKSKDDAKKSEAKAKPKTESKKATLEKPKEKHTQKAKQASDNANKDEKKPAV